MMSGSGPATRTTDRSKGFSSGTSGVTRTFSPANRLRPGCCTDARSGAAIEAAQVYLPGLNLGALSAGNGRFLIVGGVSTLIEVGVFNLLVYVWGVDLVWAKVIASLVALVNAYIGNREWTFRHRDRRGRVNELVLFVLVNAACTALGAALVWLRTAPTLNTSEYRRPTLR